MYNSIKQPYNSRRALKVAANREEAESPFVKLVSSGGTLGIEESPQHGLSQDIVRRVDELSGGKVRSMVPQALDREPTLDDIGNIPVGFHPSVPGVNLASGFNFTVHHMLRNPRTVIYVHPKTGEQWAVGSYIDEEGNHRIAWPTLEISHAHDHLDAIYRRAATSHLSGLPEPLEDTFGAAAALSRHWNESRGGSGLLTIPRAVSICLRNIYGFQHHVPDPVDKFASGVHARMWETLPGFTGVLDTSPVSFTDEHDTPERKVFDVQNRLALINHEDPDIRTHARRLIVPDSSRDGTIDYTRMDGLGRLLGNHAVWANDSAAKYINSMRKGVDTLRHKGVENDRFESYMESPSEEMQKMADLANQGRWSELSDTMYGM